MNYLGIPGDRSLRFGGIFVVYDVRIYTLWSNEISSDSRREVKPYDTLYDSSKLLLMDKLDSLGCYLPKHEFNILSQRQTMRCGSNVVMNVKLLKTIFEDAGNLTDRG